MSFDHVFDLSCGGGHVLSDTAIRALLQTGSGDAARLFLYLLTEGGHYNETDAEAALRMTVSAQRAALTALQKAGLFKELVTPIQTARARDDARLDRPGGSDGLRRETPSAAPTERPGEPPVYAAGSVAAALSKAPGFRHVVEDVQRRLGRVLSSADIGILFGLYDWRGLSPGVISLLVAHCLDEMERKRPGGHPPTLRQIDRTAALWQELGVDTEEKAEAYIYSREQGRQAVSEYARALGLSGRLPSVTEKKYMDQWAQWGFPASSVALAYDKTALQVGTLNWNYLNKILTNWHEKGLHTPEEIQRGDAPPTRPHRLSGSQPRVSAPRRTQVGADRLEQYLRGE